MTRDVQMMCAIFRRETWFNNASSPLAMMAAHPYRWIFLGGISRGKEKEDGQCKLDVGNDDPPYMSVYILGGNKEAGVQNGSLGNEGNWEVEAELANHIQIMYLRNVVWSENRSPANPPPHPVG